MRLLQKAAICWSIILNCAAFAVPSQSSDAQQNSAVERATEVVFPTFSGQFFGDISWLYLKPIHTDGDLSYGSFIDLSMPPNLTAHLLQVDPSYHSAVRAGLGYQFAKTNLNVHARYFYLQMSGAEAGAAPYVNQMLQSRFGGDSLGAQATGKQTTHQGLVAFAGRFILDGHLEVEPYIGLSGAFIRRTFDSLYTDFVGTDHMPTSDLPSSLTGRDNSRYWGVGPGVGSSFKYFPVKNWSVTGHLGLACLAGKTEAKIDSKATRWAESFHSSSSSFRWVSFASASLATTYTHFLRNSAYALEITAGYEVDYFFRAVDRISPFNGYLNNSSPYPVRTVGNLGWGGPFVRLSLVPTPCPESLQSKKIFAARATLEPSGLYGRFTSAWLKPSPSRSDLAFAIRTEPGRSDKTESVATHYTWTAAYEVGYRFKNHTYLQASYSPVTATDSRFISTKNGQELKSLNASGPMEVVFSTACSSVEYDIEQVDGIGGKQIQLWHPLNIKAYAGVRYLQLKRTTRESFSGGRPPMTTEVKHNLIKSRFRGVGILTGLDPLVTFFDSLGIVGHVNLALLVGDIYATLDQENTGLMGTSSNNLRSRNHHFIVPVVDAKGGLTYTCRLKKKWTFSLEAGYQFVKYYRVVNLMYPTFLTGLCQTNSNLAWTGPYFTIELAGLF